jgi:DNA-binding FadR family transcriptional regulator
MADHSIDVACSEAGLGSRKLNLYRSEFGRLSGAAERTGPTSTLRFTKVAMQFHAELIDAAHNRALSAQFKALRLVLEPIYAQRTSNTTATRVVATDKKVLEAIEAGDAERARSLVRRRLETIRARHSIKSVTAARRST